MVHEQIGTLFHKTIWNEGTVHSRTGKTIFLSACTTEQHQSRLMSEKYFSGGKKTGVISSRKQTEIADYAEFSLYLEQISERAEFCLNG
jgi:hypothetical protein